MIAATAPREVRPVTPPDHAAAVDENLYLIGRPKLRDYLRFMRSNAVDRPSEGTLAEEWEAAHQHVLALEKSEAGAADRPPITPLGPRYEPLLLQFFTDPLVRNNFNTVPTDIALVELDRLVVYQKHIDLTHVEALKKKIGPTPDEATVFRTSLPFDHPHPPVKWSRVHRDTFVFVSPSNDLRYLNTLSLGANHLGAQHSSGSLVGAAGVAIGFSVNFLMIVCAEGRLILTNGSHRAYALRDLGVTHVPAIIQHPGTREELDVVGAEAVRENPKLFLEHPRPPMLRDYFNPQLRKVTPVHRRNKQITVRIEVDEAYVPAL